MLDYLVDWLLCCLVTLLLGYLVASLPSLLGYLVAWLRGCFVTLLPSYLFIELLSYLVTVLVSSVVAWLLG